MSATIEVTCFSLVAVLLSPFGPITVAAHTIAMNVSGVLFMLPLSVASATTIRVGEAMGAKHWCRSLRCTISAFVIGAVIYVLCFTSLFIWHDNIIGLYTDDIEVAVLASLLVMFCAAYLLPDGFQVLAIGILRGFKDSKTIFIVTIVSYWVVGMPIGYTLSYGLITGEKMGAPGFWIGFICALSTASVLYLIRLLYLYRTRKLPKALQSNQDKVDQATKEALAELQKEGELKA